jgi:hypothetical protein
MAIKDTDKNRRILHFLKQHKVGSLATVDPDGLPQVSVIYYGVDDDFVITFLTKTGTKKHDNLSHNVHATLLVYDEVNQITAQVMGRAHEMPAKSQDAFVNTLKASMETSEAGIPPISKLIAGDYVAYQLKPIQIRMAVFSRPDPGDYTEVFETIEEYELEA